MDKEKLRQVIRDNGVLCMEFVFYEDFENAIMVAIDQYKDAAVESALGGQYQSPRAGENVLGTVSQFMHAEGGLEPGETIMVAAYSNKIPPLKPLKWDEKFDMGQMRANCPNSGFDYQVSIGINELFFTDWRKNPGWNRIGDLYESIDEAKDSCERHRNQRLRDQLQ
jgi:hypothetical protein